MLKNILSVAATALAVSAMLAVSANTAFAESTKKLTDDADILLDSQEESIENNLKKCTLATGWDTIIYTNNNNVIRMIWKIIATIILIIIIMAAVIKKAALCSL